ncbi:MAG: 4Fe-4S dicluster domain-containing protein [Bacteroidetes bacterium]|nr:4Fe-4S dicluster domain-containing protein [Bacteroidota bacterium]
MNKRFDERDTMFSRMFEIAPGTEKYSTYYAEHPELEKNDKVLRNHPKGVFSDRIRENAVINGGFGLLRDLRIYSGAESVVQKNPQKENQSSLTPQELTHFLQDTAVSYGAVLSGSVPTDLQFVYERRGRGRHYGKLTEEVLPNTFVYAVEMDAEAVNKAPAIEESMEVVKKYIQVAVIGLVLSYTLREMGYYAVCHIDGESQLVLPLAADEAGLGSIGWMGILLTKKFGPKVRLGAVTTDAPLATSEIKDFNVLEFCKTCGKCAELCPSAAIAPLSSTENAVKPSINHERCYKTWKELGTDCGVCLAVCPFGKNMQKSPDKLAPGDPDFLKSFLFSGK